MPLATDVTLDSTTWAALALVLTVLGVVYTWFSWRRRGLAAGLRGLAWTLVPLAAWLTGTLKLAANVVDAVLSWATRLVFSPTVWLGIVVAGIAVALGTVSGMLRARNIGVSRTPGQIRGASRQRPSDTRRRTTPLDSTSSTGPPADHDDMSDIEAILKRHGI